MNILCQISGGADSTLAAIQAIEQYDEAKFFGVFFDYGQICVNQEMKAAKDIVRRLCLPLRVINISNVWITGGMITGESKEGVSVYTPMRNAVFATLSMAYADSIQADIIITGSKGFFKTEDTHSYYDSTVLFHDLVKSLWQYTTEDKRIVSIINILTKDRQRPMTKEEVYKALYHYDYDYEDTWSCFRGVLEECGECSNCITKREIYKRMENEQVKIIMD